MSIPIIFIHRGDDEFIFYSLSQAKRSNPESKVILIGDLSNIRACPDGVEHFRIEDYEAGAAQFAEIYRHLSSNSYDYELFCYQRWFILRDFLRTHGLSRYGYLDSDVMLYIDLNELENQAFSNGFTWFNVGTTQKLERFCDLMSAYYRDPSLFEQLVHYSNRIGHSSISDMVFSSLYPEHYPEDSSVRDQAVIDALHYYGIYNGSLFDANINWPYNHYSPDFPPDHEPIEMIGDKKKVYRIAGSPFCKFFEAYVGIGVLHFQGPDSKRFIPYFHLPEEASDTEEWLYFDYQSCQWLQV